MNKILITSNNRTPVLLAKDGRTPKWLLNIRSRRAMHCVSVHRSSWISMEPVPTRTTRTWREVSF